MLFTSVHYLMVWMLTRPTSKRPSRYHYLLMIATDNAEQELIARRVIYHWDPVRVCNRLAVCCCGHDHVLMQWSTTLLMASHIEAEA